MPATYFVLTFLISWGGLLVVLGPGAFTGVTAPTEGLLPLVYLAMFAGPSVAGILMKALVDGKAGFHDLRSRLLKWRVDVRWYVVALLTAPLVMMAVLLPLSLGSTGFLPGVFASGDKVPLLVIGLAAGLMTGLCEELGWTGFVIPRLRLRYGVLTTGLVVGLFLPVQLFPFLPAYRVLMVWVDDRTGSLHVAMLMHVLAAVLWLLIAALAMTNGRQLSGPPLRPRMA